MSGSLKLLISLSRSKSDIIVTTQDTTNIHIKLSVDIFPNVIIYSQKWSNLRAIVPPTQPIRSCLDIPHTRRPDPTPSPISIVPNDRVKNISVKE